MKILELASSLSAGGGERFIVDLSNELSKTNEVYLLKMRSFQNSDFYIKELSKQIHLINLHEGCSFWSKIKQLFISLYWIIKIKPDIVHGHLVAINWMLLPSILYRKPKYYFTIHNLAENECDTKFGFLIRKYLFKNRVHAITISNICDISFYRFYGFHSFKAINNGCRDMHTTSSLPEVKKEIDSYKLNSSTKVYVNVARNAIQKNHELLISSFEKFLDMGANAILLIIGDWNQLPERKERLLEMITSDKIHFIGPKNNVSDYLYYSNIFCLSSNWEGLPISVLEAGLSGCYPILTPVGGNKDIIIGENWGLLSHSCLEEDYIKVLIKAYKKNFNRNEIKQLYKLKFSMKTCAKVYVNIFMK